MAFADLADGTSVFIDANIFVYAFAPDPVLGTVCTQLLERIEQGRLKGYTSSHVLSDTAHRLMTLEACATFSWPYTGIASRMQRHSAEIQKLGKFRTAIESVIAIHVQVIPVTSQHILSATALSQRLGILTNDAVVVSVMLENSLSHLASHDADFDRVPDVIRVSPV